MRCPRSHSHINRGTYGSRASGLCSRPTIGAVHIGQVPRSLIEPNLRPGRIPTVPGLDDELLTVMEISSILKLNPQTIRNWIDAGTLPHVRLGERRVRVYRSDFDALSVGPGTR
jgi:excisionase family DNA binding protein